MPRITFFKFVIAFICCIQLILFFAFTWVVDTSTTQNTSNTNTTIQSHLHMTSRKQPADENILASIIVPAYKEGRNVRPLVERVFAAIDKVLNRI